MIDPIRIAVIGVGNCCSALLQGIEFYRQHRADSAPGLMHWEVGGYAPSDIQIVAAFDIDERKVGQDISKAIFSPPNCTTVFCNDIPVSHVTVMKGPVLDGVSAHMADYAEKEAVRISEAPELNKEEVVQALIDSGAEILVNYLPVGSECAALFYMECALEARVGFINNMPVFIASHPERANAFEAQNLPIIGDDIKSQLGATITHRVLADLCKKRGVKIQRTYQLNTGGNTDFLNMLNQSRLASKKQSKTEAVLSVAGDELLPENVHIGPSDYVPWQKDNKVCFIRIEGELFGGVPMNMELRLSVEDSPNSAGVAIDSIRCMKVALSKGIGGVLHGPSSYFMKHPPQQVDDAMAHERLSQFIESA